MPDPQAGPQLIYDGDCGICRYWVDYWQGQTGDTVIYRTYQNAIAEFPEITGIYEYRFSDPQLRRQQNLWWTRSLKGLYVPPLMLEGEKLRRAPGDLDNSSNYGMIANHSRLACLNLHIPTIEA